MSIYIALFRETATERRFQVLFRGTRYETSECMDFQFLFLNVSTG